MSTMIDVLRRGNQELFHSSMIGWLLDPNAEHGFGSAFLSAFSALLAERGEARLQDALMREGAGINRGRIFRTR